MQKRTWEHITPLEPKTEHNLTVVDEIHQQWQELQASASESPQATAEVEQFKSRLHRSWAIETGIIEGIYQLDEAQTQTLIKQGFELSAIPSSDTGQEPDNLLSILQDHMTALEAIYSAILDQRTIQRWAIHQLHRIIVAHQPTYRAMNQFGQWFDATLQAGSFKILPNNPTRPDGITHEYCPPIHVEAEIDNLLNWYGDYCAQPDSYHPLVVAAWLHHRLTQIHPFPDGNGRMTRAIVSWHLVQHGYLPIVVTRHQRNAYIDALEAADDGDLGPLVEFTAQQQSQHMTEAVQNQWTPAGTV